jgi:O-antigen/teichoic acid export membrane protein
MSIKILAKNTVVYAIGSIALRFTTFLLIPLYMKFLTQEAFGFLQTLLFTIQILITINDVGMRTATMRFFAEYEKKNQVGALLGSTLFLNISVGLLLLLIAFFIPNSFSEMFYESKNLKDWSILVVAVGFSQTLYLNILSYFRARNNGFAYVIIGTLASIFLMIVTYLTLVPFGMRVAGVLYAQIMVFGTVWIIVMVWILYRYLLRIDRSVLKKIALFGFPLIFAMSGDLVILTVGNYLLGYFKGLQEVAIWALGLKLASISVMILIIPFQMAYEPYIFKLKDSPDLKNGIGRITTYMIILFMLISVVILYLSRDLIFIIGGEEYRSSYYLLFLILPGIGFNVISYVGQSLLHMKNKTETTGILMVFVTALSVLISYYCIKIFSIWGFVIGISFYNVSSAVMLYWLGNRITPATLEYRRILWIVTVGVLFFLLIFKISFYSNFIFYSSFFLSFVIIYIMLTYTKLLNNEEKEKISKLVNEMFHFKRIIVNNKTI